MKKGFTLIELLIVITIIGILAVAFLPTILGAPVKGRDTQRIADLQKISKVLISFDLETGYGYPDANTSIYPGKGTGFPVPYNNWGNAYRADLGGNWPTHPDGSWYWYTAAVGDYSFAVRGPVELFENANSHCSSANSGELGTPILASPSTWCYTILVK